MENTPVSVIIPAWNNWALTKDCLAALAAHTPLEALQVIVVDNGSTDETALAGPAHGAALFGERYGQVRLPGNRGFAAACNRGAQAASGRFLFFLNNDALAETGWLDPLVEAMRGDPSLAGAGPVLTFPKDGGVNAGRIQHLGIAVSGGPEFRHLYELFPASHEACRKTRRMQIITAAAMLVPAKLFAGLGGFYEGFVNGMEDVDFCCRAAKNGGRFAVVPKSRAVHLTNRTAGRFDREGDNLRLLVSRRHAPLEDLCGFAAADGYVPFFTPWLDLILVPGPERAAAIKASWAADPDPARLPELLEKEPLWDEGYVLWGRADPAKALTAAGLRAALIPGEEAFVMNAALLKRAGLKELSAKNLNYVKGIRTLMADAEALSRKARNLERKTRDQAALAALQAWKSGQGAP